MPARRWVLTEPMRKRLVREYDGRSETIDRLTAEWDVPRHVVKRWAFVNGRTRTKERRWSDEEVEYLEAHLGVMSAPRLARKLGRSRLSVQMKIKRLGLRGRDDGWTMDELALGLGCEERVISRWIADGWLRGRRRVVDGALSDGFYPVGDGALRDFVRAHAGELDPQRFDWLWLAGVLVGVR